MEHGGQDLGTTYDCKTPGCAGTARSRVGRYSYCDECQRSRAAAAQGDEPTVARATQPRAGKVAQLDSLKALARDADRARAKAAKATQKALALKRAADAADEKYRTALREAVAA